MKIAGYCILPQTQMDSIHQVKLTKMYISYRSFKILNPNQWMGLSCSRQLDLVNWTRQFSILWALNGIHFYRISYREDPD